MDDLCILELYAERSEAAVRQTDEKYGRYCRRIAYDILLSTAHITPPCLGMRAATTA